MITQKEGEALSAALLTVFAAKLEAHYGDHPNPAARAVVREIIEETREAVKLLTDGLSEEGAYAANAAAALALRA